MDYSPDDYNEHGILKAPIGLILTLLYSIKHYVLIVALALGARRSGVLKDFLLDIDKDFILLAGTIPALLVLFAMFRRQPGAPNLLRSIWKHGIILISATLLFDALYLGFLQIAGAQRISMAALFIIFFDIWFVFYLMTTKRIKDVFNEFP